MAVSGRERPSRPVQSRHGTCSLSSTRGGCCPDGSHWERDGHLDLEAPSTGHALGAPDRRCALLCDRAMGGSCIEQLRVRLVTDPGTRLGVSSGMADVFANKPDRWLRATTSSLAGDQWGYLGWLALRRLDAGGLRSAALASILIACGGVGGGRSYPDSARGHRCEQNFGRSTRLEGGG